MDKEKAKFILQSFRPDGADSTDPSFAEALALAAADRELGDWLARERAQDAAFAAAVSSIPIPEDLRITILEFLNGEGEGANGLDAEFIGALATLTPPPGLRDQILNAMEMERQAGAEENVIRPKRWLRLSSMGAAAAAIVLGLFIMFGTGGNAIAVTTIEEVHESAIKMLEAPLFRLDLTEPKQASIYDWLQKKELPAPEFIPPGLRQLDGVGCKELAIGESEAPGSLICYRLNSETIVHLVVMKKEDLGEEVPDFSSAAAACSSCEEGKWAVTQWTDVEHAFFLLSKMDSKGLADLF